MSNNGRSPGSASPGHTPSSFAWLGFLLPPALIALLYAPTLGHGFVWDDDFVTRLPVYTRFDLAAILTRPANGFEYLPVRDLTLLVDHALFGDWAGGFHLVNAVLFAVSSVLAFALFRELFAAARQGALRERAPLMALLCTLVLVAHPLQVEPVAFATQRNALLALLFSLAAVLAYARALSGQDAGALRRLPYALSFVFSVAALFSKSTALSLVLVIGLVDLYLRRGDALRRALLRVSPHAVATLLAAGLHLAVAGSHGVLRGAASSAALLTRLPRAVFVPEFYLWKTLWPVELCIEYDLDPVLDHLWLLAGISALVWALLAVVVLRGWRERSFVWFATLAYLAALVPVMNLLPTHPPIADRYAQIPLVFLVPLLLAPLLSRLPTRAAVGLTVVLVATLGVFSFRQVPVWKSSESLFAHAVAVNPRATQSLGNFGMLLWDAQRRDEAVEVFARLAEVDPDDFQYDLVRGWQALDRGDLGMAEHWLESAAGKTGTMKHLVYLKLGELHEKRRDRTAAIAAYERALAMARTTPAAGAHVDYLEAALRRLATRRR